MTKTNSRKETELFDRVASILEEARSNVVRTVNSHMVIAYWLIGREIVQEQQGGKKRAGYGDVLLEDLSEKLKKRYGRGYSVTNLKYFRKFHLVYSERLPEIRHLTSDELDKPAKVDVSGSQSDDYRKRYMSCSELADKAKENSVSDLQSAEFAKQYLANSNLEKENSPIGFSSSLSWTHYRLLMRVDNEHARAFYEVEAMKEHWVVVDLERQINSLLFERMLKSRDKKGVMDLAREGNRSHNVVDILKDPFVLEFLDLPEGHELVESKVEQALVDHMRQFLLELGSGFAFVARQQRLTLDGDHFYVDLTFYHTRLKCYVLIDLKMGKLTQQDLGQMQLYVNYYDRELCAPDDNPTVGLILCTDRNEAMVQYTLPKDQKQIHAARYRIALPSEEELIKLLRRDWDMVVREQGINYGEKHGHRNTVQARR